MICRTATPADLDSIVSYQLLMARETEDLELEEATCRKGVEAVFQRPELGTYYVAEENGTAIGCLLTTFEWSDWRNGTVWWIQSVFVDETLRGRGVYAQLYAHVKRLAESDPSVRGIRLYVDRRNVNAQRVYARLGMNGEHYQLFEWMKE